MIWVERKEGALWAVGRSVNPQHRRSDEPPREDYVFEGYELGDALEAANGVLEDDVRVKGFTSPTVPSSSSTRTSSSSTPFAASSASPSS